LFTSNDSIVNFGIALSGALVMWIGSNWPDLVIGLIVAIVAALGAKEILDDANDAARTGKDSS
jgi:Co/Zn/Cd efflux system component